MMDDLLDGADLVGVADAIRVGDVSAVEVLQHTLKRIAERDGTVTAIAELCEAIPEPRDGPLRGVPFVVKDLGVQVAGMHNRDGSRLFADRIASVDSELVSRYRDAGLVIVATTKTPELGKAPTTEPVLGGPARNPHRLTHSAGGSSGGTAAAVAVGMVPAGHGNDGGGSIRIPASMCGLVGLKPTRGRTPWWPKPIAYSYPVGINHVLTRSVRDSAVLLDIGAATGDRFSAEVGAPPGRLRVALGVDAPYGAPTHPDCRAAAEGTAHVLESLGHHVDAVEPEWPVDAVRNALNTVMSAALVVDVEGRLEELGRELQPDDLEPMTLMMYEAARQMPASALVRALHDVDRAARTMDSLHDRYDVLLSPTVSQPVPPLGLIDTTNPASIIEHAASYAAFTGVANVTGQPAISLPLATDSTGLPCGVQLVAAWDREDLLLRVAAQVEQAQPWSIAPVWPGRAG
jgi:amidase